MTREETKELLPIMQAFSEGKTVQIQIRTSSEVTPLEWIDAQDIDWDREASCYRIKPEPKYRPFKDAEECWQEMQKHQPFGWLKDKEDGREPMWSYHVGELVDDAFFITNGDKYYWSEGFNNCTFADGEPFGVKEVEVEKGKRVLCAPPSESASVNGITLLHRSERICRSSGK